MWGLGANKEDELGVETAMKNAKTVQFPSRISFSSAAKKGLKVIQVSPAESHTGLVTECG